MMTYIVWHDSGDSSVTFDNCVYDLVKTGVMKEQIKAAYEARGSKVFCIEEVDGSLKESEKAAIRMASALQVAKLDLLRD